MGRQFLQRGILRTRRTRAHMYIKEERMREEEGRNSLYGKRSRFKAAPVIFYNAKIDN
jgi:hypothetical protein